MRDVVIVGYSGHAFLACEIFRLRGIRVAGYFEQESKALNPYQLDYLGNENAASADALFQQYDVFVAIGENKLREKISQKLAQRGATFINCIHPNTTVASTATLGNGVMIGCGGIVQPLAVMGDGAVCSTASIIEHENTVEPFAHVGPRVMLCGTVHIGARTFVGAGAVVINNLHVGKDVYIGAGTIVLKDLPDGSRVVGNPHRFI